MTKRRLVAVALSLATLLGACRSESPSDRSVDPPPPKSTSSDDDASVDESPGQAPEELSEQPSPEQVASDERGLDDEADALPPGLPTKPDPDLLEDLPTIDELPALSAETTLDETAKQPFAQVGEFRVRDGVYYLRMVGADGMRELIMTVETQTNGFVVRRGDRTRLRFLVDGDAVTFASEPGSGEIAGRGKALGDDWVQGAFRTTNADGTTTEGVFELRKLYDPPLPREPEEATPNGAAAGTPPTAEARED